MHNEEHREIFFIGISERYYSFTLYPLDMDLPDKGAVYICARIQQGHIEPLYIGQTDSLMSYNQHHEKWACICQHRANSICTFFEPCADTRLQIEKDLIGAQQPKCNDL